MADRVGFTIRKLSMNASIDGALEAVAFYQALVLVLGLH